MRRGSFRRHPSSWRGQGAAPFTVRRLFPRPEAMLIPIGRSRGAGERLQKGVLRRGTGGATQFRDSGASVVFERVALAAELGRSRGCGRGQSPPRRQSPNEPEIVSRWWVTPAGANVDRAQDAPRISFLDRALDNLVRHAPREPGDLNQVFGSIASGVSGIASTSSTILKRGFERLARSCATCADRLRACALGVSAQRRTPRAGRQPISGYGSLVASRVARVFE